MSVNKNVRQRALQMRRGEPFTNGAFLKLGSRASVDKALSRLVEEGVINRVARGVFVRPKKSPYVGEVMPEASRVLEVIARNRGETLQVHGAEAARRFKLSTQMPTKPVYYTNGPSREIRVGKLNVKLVHTANPKRLQHAGEKPGMALSALWYLGKENVGENTIERIREGLSEEEFEILRRSKMPAWMASAIQSEKLEIVNG